MVFNGMIMYLSLKFENASIGSYYDPILQEFSPIQATIQRGTSNSSSILPQTHSDFAKFRLHAFSGYKYNH